MSDLALALDLALFLIAAPFIYAAWWCHDAMRKSLALFLSRLSSVAPQVCSELILKMGNIRDKTSKSMFLFTYIHSGIYAELGDETVTRLGRKASHLVVGSFLTYLIVVGYFYFLILWHFNS